jgi:hypothetical protein
MVAGLADDHAHNQEIDHHQGRDHGHGHDGPPLAAYAHSPEIGRTVDQSEWKDAAGRGLDRLCG